MKVIEAIHKLRNLPGSDEISDHGFSFSDKKQKAPVKVKGNGESKTSQTSGDEIEEPSAKPSDGE